jgi:DNA-binding GntR family transcriptional regulator
VAAALRSALITGSLRPGVVYSAPTLAAQFGVSATPVREAMLDLAKEKLVEVIRNKGFRVAELTQQDLDDVAELRLLIEVPIIARLARNPDRHALEGLRPLAEAIEAAAEEEDMIGLINADTAFHLGLLELAKNKHLVQLVSDLRARSRLYRLSVLATQGELWRTVSEHTELLNVVIAGDEERARQLMAHHIQHVRGEWADTRIAIDAVQSPPMPPSEGAPNP